MIAAAAAAPVRFAPPPSLTAADAPCVALPEEEGLGDPGVLALHTRALLTETGLSFREQERHTGVSASAVYAMAQGSAQRRDGFSVRRFAAFAAHRAREAAARAYWQALSERLAHEERRRIHPPAERSAVRGTSAAGREAARALLRSVLGEEESE